jgi:hypothetical protein
MALVIPQPKLSQDKKQDGPFASEKPIMLSCGPVTFADGSVLLPEKIKKFGYFLFRRQSSGSAGEVWAEKSGEPGAWVPDGVRPEPLPLAYEEKDKTWQMVLVAMGQKDKDGNNKFETRASGYPQYFVQCIFRGTDSTGTEQEGTGPESRAVEIYAAGVNNLAGLALEPPDPVTATEIRLFLKDQSLAEKGLVAIRKKDAGFEIDLSVNGATIRLTNTGDIEVSPAPSKQVTISGGLTVFGTLNVVGVLSINGVTVVAP